MLRKHYWTGWFVSGGNSRIHDYSVRVIRQIRDLSGDVSPVKVSPPSLQDTMKYIMEYPVGSTARVGEKKHALVRSLA